MKKLLPVLCSMALFTGCATGPIVTGSAIVLDQQQPIPQQLASNQVTLYLSPPLKQYQPIAMVTASGHMGHYSDLSRLESALVEELRKQAASIGANGIMQIEKEILTGQTVISRSAWREIPPAERTHQPPPPLANARLETSQKTISSEYSVIYRGKAILVTE